MKQLLVLFALLMSLSAFSQTSDTVKKVQPIRTGYPNDITMNRGMYGTDSGFLFAIRPRISFPKNKLYDGLCTFEVEGAVVRQWIYYNNNWRITASIQSAFYDSVFNLVFARFGAVDTALIRHSDSLKRAFSRMDSISVYYRLADAALKQAFIQADTLLSSRIDGKLDTSGKYTDSVLSSLPSALFGPPVYSKYGHTFFQSTPLLTQSQNRVFASPNGSSGAPIFRSLVASDIPDISANYIANSSSLQTGTFRISGAGIMGVLGLIGQSNSPTSPGQLSYNTSTNGFQVYAGSQSNYLSMNPSPSANSVQYSAGTNGLMANSKYFSDGTNSTIGGTGSYFGGGYQAGGLSIRKDADFTGAGTYRQAQLAVGQSSTNQAVLIGFVSDGFGYVQSANMGVALTTLALQPAGGLLLVGAKTTNGSNGIMEVGGQITPSVGGIYSLGSPGFPWSAVYSGSLYTNTGANNYAAIVGGATPYLQLFTTGAYDARIYQEGNGLAIKNGSSATYGFLSTAGLIANVQSKFDAGSMGAGTPSAGSYTSAAILSSMANANFQTGARAGIGFVNSGATGTYLYYQQGGFKHIENTGSSWTLAQLESAQSWTAAQTFGDFRMLNTNTSAPTVSGQMSYRADNLGVQFNAGGIAYWLNAMQSPLISYVPRIIGSSGLTAPGVIQDNGTNASINTTPNSNYALLINGVFQGGGVTNGVKLTTNANGFGQLTFYSAVDRFNIYREGNDGVSLTNTGGYVGHINNTGWLIGGAQRSDLPSYSKFTVLSTTQGSQPFPSMAASQAAAIASPGDGLFEYINDRKLVQYYDPVAATYRYLAGAGRNGQSGGSYTITLSDINRVVGLTGTGARTVTLPDASTFPQGCPVFVKDEAGTASVANPITIARTGTNTIDGATSSSIVTPYGHFGYYSNGSNWFIQ